MVASRYTPDRGDIVWLNFDPVRGHEQGGKRPALVVSAFSYNAKTSLALICPITSRVKGYEFEVALSGVDTVRGVVLADHVHSLDWRARRARFIGCAPEPIVARVAEFISILAQGA
jgi:mRNA interferase MazF